MSETSVFWPGEPVDKKHILELLRRFMLPEYSSGRLHYVWTSASRRRNPEVAGRMRLMWLDKFLPIPLEAAFDGVQSVRNFEKGDVYVGSFEALNKYLAWQYGGLSIIFHLHHIRINYVVRDNESILENIYYHTRKPAGKLLQHIVDALDMVIHEVGSPRSERARSLLDALLKQLVFEIENEEEPQFTPQSLLAMRLQDYIDHNFHQPINCNSICEALKVNRSYASTTFRAVFNETMKAYLTRLRLEAAENLLTSQADFSIAEIAESCAFPDCGYFIRVFRAHYGVTPGEYRRR